MSFVGGVWADRHSKKTLIIGADALIALLTLGMVVLLPKFNDGTSLRVALLVLVSLKSIAAGRMSDLSHLENCTEVYGLIGYDVYRDYDLLFDYKGKTLTLIDPDYTETFLKEHKYEYDDVPIEMSKAMRHIPLVNGRIGTANLTFGIDCGASSDLIDSGRWGEFKNMMKRVKTTKLKGVSNDKGTNVHTGILFPEQPAKALVSVGLLEGGLIRPLLGCRDYRAGSISEWPIRFGLA